MTMKSLLVNFATICFHLLPIVGGFHLPTSPHCISSLEALGGCAKHAQRVQVPENPIRRTESVKMFFGGGGGAGMPKLYDGWFKKTGQIRKDMIAGAKSALRTGKPVEINFFPVPNIDEVQFGTATNQLFGKEVAIDLGMGEYKPGSTIRTYLLPFSNVYWAKKLAEGLGGTVWVVTTDGLKKDKTVVSKPGKAKFCSLRKPETLEGICKGDTVIVVAPGPTMEWNACVQRFSEQKVSRFSPMGRRVRRRHTVY
ncbi:unnamed protein product [Choristocarpus tenellus]